MQIITNVVDAWFSGVPGREIAKDQIAQLDRMLPNLFGYHLLQVGRLADFDLIQADEYRRLKSRDRQVLHVTELDESDIHAIADAEVPGEYAHLDAELKS